MSADQHQTTGPCGRAACDGHVMGCSRADCPSRLENKGYVLVRSGKWLDEYAIRQEQPDV